ncbi:hypothetical protein O181_027120 [Austropuccinia psidii MF-1]|uniref:Uncharacterized protein n=1 Tax=Austropuccinia psidii MF-1 TaxID=1389203 RepID=A0A9Q3H2V9_9BASI|nr:hypothetical protein [Austropuccinia psidii MF-1]
MLVILANKNTRSACSWSDPSNHTYRGVPNQDALVGTPLWLAMMKAFPSGNGHQDPKQTDGNDSGQLAQSPQDGEPIVIIFYHPWDSNAKNPPGPSPSSKPHEDVMTSCPTPPHSVIIIDNRPIGSPSLPVPPRIPPPPLIPTMRHATNLPAYDEP